MTLILTVQTQGSIWLAADRRLSTPSRPPVDDAIKATVVEVADGIAILGYAGLGATVLGNQPSKWVSNTLRGRHHPIEQMLQVIAEAMSREFPPHMEKIRNVRSRQHCFLVPVFQKGGPRLYTIEMHHSGKGYQFGLHRQFFGGSPRPLELPPSIAWIGSGSAALEASERWKRPILRLVKAFNRKRIGGEIVAKHLAQTVYSSHLDTEDGTVGPDCLVVWRSAKGSPQGGGGASEFFSHGEPSQHAAIPRVTVGIDGSALDQISRDVLLPHAEWYFAARRRGEEPPEIAGLEDEMNQRMSSMPSTPDEKLP